MLICVWAFIRLVLKHSYISKNWVVIKMLMNTQDHMLHTNTVFRVTVSLRRKLPRSLFLLEQSRLQAWRGEQNSKSSWRGGCSLQGRKKHGEQWTKENVEIQQDTKITEKSKYRQDGQGEYDKIWDPVKWLDLHLVCFKPFLLVHNCQNYPCSFYS